MSSNSVYVYLMTRVLCTRWDVAVEYVPEDDGVDPPLPESPQQEAAAADGEQQQAAAGGQQEPEEAGQ